MIREVDLVSYLPPFVAEYKETNITLTAENPEFALVWKAADRALKNEFIATADEYGISRFEKLLGIWPSEEDTLEGRRSRVQSRWFSRLPYTLRILIQKLTVLCGHEGFRLMHDFGAGYSLTLETGLGLYGQVEELEDMLDTLLPCNMTAGIKNTLSCGASGELYAYGGIAFAQDIYITS